MNNDIDIAQCGVVYEAIDYNGSDCGFEGGRSCAFADNPRCFEFARCTPDKRLDGRNVIFVEKHP